MKTLLLLLGIYAASIAAVTGAGAQNYPWCALLSKGDGVDQNCGFQSFEQCMATVRGIGGFCMQNNTYNLPSDRHPSMRRSKDRSVGGH